MVALILEWQRRGKTVCLVKEAWIDGTFVETGVANEADIRSCIEKSAKTYGRSDIR